MKTFGAAVMAVTIFIVAWTITSGGLAVLALTLGGDSGPLMPVQMAALVLGPLVAGLMSVYVSGRMVSDLPSGRVWLTFVVTSLVVAAFFTWPYYLHDGPEQGTADAFKAVVMNLVLAPVGGWAGKMWLDRFRAKKAAQPAPTDGAA